MFPKITLKSAFKTTGTDRWAVKDCGTERRLAGPCLSEAMAIALRGPPPSSTPGIDNSMRPVKFPVPVQPTSQLEVEWQWNQVEPRWSNHRAFDHIYPQVPQGVLSQELEVIYRRIPLVSPWTSQLEAPWAWRWRWWQSWTWPRFGRTGAPPQRSHHRRTWDPPRFAQDGAPQL